MPWFKGRFDRRPAPATWPFLGDPPGGFTYVKDENGHILVLATIEINPNESNPIGPRNSLSVSGSAISDSSIQGGAVLAKTVVWNSATWDLYQNNVEFTVLASAARTASTTSANQTNYNAKGMILFYSVTAVSGTSPTLAPGVDLKAVVGTGFPVWFVATTNITATGTYTYLFYPSASTAGSGLTQAVNTLIPRTWRTNDTIGGTTPSFTYSSGGCYLN